MTTTPLSPGEMSPLEPGEWIKRARGAGYFRVIGPWPQKPDRWVVACAGEDRTMAANSLHVLPGQVLVSIRKWRHDGQDGEQ